MVWRNIAVAGVHALHAANIGLSPDTWPLPGEIPECRVRCKPGI